MQQEISLVIFFCCSVTPRATAAAPNAVIRISFLALVGYGPTDGCGMCAIIYGGGVD